MFTPPPGSPILEFEVPGEPQGKGRLRHRVVRSKANPLGYASGYTPAKTVLYEKLIADRARDSVWRQLPLEGPVFLHVVAYLKIPKAFSRAKRSAALCGQLRPTKKPDWDNFGKVVSDALNLIAFKDDSQVADAFVQKFYSDNPRMRIVVMPSIKGVCHEYRPTNSANESTAGAAGRPDPGLQDAA